MIFKDVSTNADCMQTWQADVEGGSFIISNDTLGATFPTSEFHVSFVAAHGRGLKAIEVAKCSSFNAAKLACQQYTLPVFINGNHI